MRDILCAQAPPAVDDQHQTNERFAHVEIVLHQRQPLEPDPFGYLGESIPRQVHQAALRREFEKIDQLRAPGVRLTRASPLRCVMTLMAVDFPELERPAKATSLPASGAS